MLELKHISKRYQYQKVLDDIDMVLPECGFVSLIGPSGCGKSTLLNIIGGIDSQFSGQIFYNQKNVNRHLSRYRKKHISFLFQNFHLISWLSVGHNIHLSRFFHSQNISSNQLDTSGFEKLKINALSLGQRQRIAYLRAQKVHSDILLCDEPTGSLDEKTAKQVMQLLKEESKHRLVIMVSHNEDLVQQYSDEIYQMEDGRIINHQVLHQCHFVTTSQSKQRKYPLSQLYLSLLSLKSHRLRSIQLIFALTISLLCIILTLTMSRGVEKQIEDYIYSLVPQSSISFQSTHHQSLDQDIVKQMKQNTAIERVHLYLKDYECLGISFQKEHYEESTSLFIGDDSLPYEQLSLKKGHYPTEKNQILVSLSTAQHLCQNANLSTLLNHKVYAWYKHDLKVDAIEYEIVGITKQVTTIDTLYQQENAYIDLLKETYQLETLESQLGLIFVDKHHSRQDVIHDLKKAYNEYEFKEVGASTISQISQKMKQFQIILGIFSLLAILSSLFLIGEVMFLNVIQKKKDLAIMKCYGASSFQVMMIVLLEAIDIVFFSEIIATFLYRGALLLVNQWIQEQLLLEGMTFSFDYQLVVMVYVLVEILVLFVQIFPLFYVFRLNIANTLKD